MTKTHAVRTLEKNRANLRADLVHLEMMKEKTLAGLAHIEATLALLRDAKKRGAPNGLQRRWLFKRGELRRLILAIDGEAGECPPAHEVARAIIARMDWDRNDDQLVLMLAMKVRNARRLMPPGVTGYSKDPRSLAASTRLP